MYLSVAIWILSFDSIASEISVTFEPNKPAVNGNVTILCTRTGSSTAAIDWEVDSSPLTTCSGTTDNSCFPPVAEYTISNDVAANIFSLFKQSVTVADCKTYRCTDGTDTDSKNLFVEEYDSSETVLTDPGEFSSGTITLTTGCVLSPSDVTVSWNKVKKNNVEADLDYEVTKTTDATGCTDTCHSETSKKVVSSFVHTECESDCEEVTFRAHIRHSSYAGESVEDSAWKYRVKKGSTSTSTTPPTTATSTPTTSTSPPNVTDSDDKKIIIGVSVGVGSAVVLAIVIAVCCYSKHRNKVRKQKHSENTVSYSNDQEQNLPQKYSPDNNRL